MDKATELMEALTEQVETLRTSEGWQAWLAHAARFHRYSANNVLLIAMQKPDATQVAGFRRWQEMGRQVRKGERALYILAPMVSKRTEKDEKTGEETTRKVVRGFRGAAVFDVAQTDGEELPKSPSQIWRERLEATIPDVADKERLQKLTDAAEKLGFQVIVDAEAPHDGALGWHKLGSDAVHVVAGDPGRMAATLAHELSHALDPELGKATYAVSELVAESSAHVVSAVLGMDTTEVSAAYLAGWDGDLGRLHSIAERALKIAQKILDASGVEADKEVA